jgi:hypothetical protein
MTELLICLVLALGIMFCMLVSVFRRLQDCERQQSDLLKTWRETNHQLNLHAIDINHKNVTLYGQYGTLKERRK